MKNKLLAVMAIFGMVASASAVKVNNNLSINGFIDGSYSSVDNGNAAAGANKQQSLAVDEVEVNFVVNVGNVSGLVAFDTHGAGNHNSIDLEQAHFTYNINDAVSVSFGRYGSALGLEGEDPAGLYTFSRAYSDAYRNANNSATGTVNQGSAFNFANLDGVPGTNDGIKISYSGQSYSLGLSLQNESANANALETNDLDIELSFSFTGIENTVIGGGYLTDNEVSGPAGNVETNAFNIYATRQFGKLLLGVEFSELDQEGNGNTTNDLPGGPVVADDSRDAYMILADYDFSDKLGVALRVSSAEKANNGGDFDRFTIAPNYAITESLGAILEFSDIDDAGNDIEEYAVELTYTF